MNYLWCTLHVALSALSKETIDWKQCENVDVKKTKIYYKYIQMGQKSLSMV